nr:uncharacterized protein LOC111505469 [Leptinotarsa decemlineata]XP_023016050.1 uncharacterized protein LOC111505469 [Leptinotarsa decemlineata]XP_023016051.1 uncharacterized protein LOC111505469 [Leptinotarsa decemlineata]XP_023016052.1 uncharacterized protein LOC111505469 [Leptinotarsa decemlineata]XP_023016053.1 uncharacterized protein LOC111505469 [Leptinotarsa decemlineata]
MALPTPSQLGLSKSSLGNLKCSLCSGFLSVPPICFAGHKYTCGRCSSTGNRVTIYEELAKYMIFPCIHEKCNVQVPWGQVENHELACPHKEIRCPFGSCKTYFKVKTVIQHVEDCHKICLHTNELTIPRRLRDIPLKNFNADRKVFLLVKNNVPFIGMAYINCTLNNKKAIKGYELAFGVYSFKNNVGSMTDATYQVELMVKNSNQDVNYIWEYQEIKLFNEKLHCFDCFTGNCKLPHHSNDKKNFLTSRLDNIDKVGDMNVTYTIKIETKKRPQEKLLPHSSGKQTEVYKVICSFCRDIMCAPIFVCGCGQSLCCSSCKHKSLSCPFCREKLGQTRNLVVEKITEVLQISCQNIAKGCKYTGTVKSTKQHIINCKYNFL